jgi:hypothetical protein
MKTRRYLGDCLYTIRDYVAFSVGMSSIAFWVVCQMPQLVSNCRSKSVAALSFWFIAQWFLGDILNLLGCFLTDQVGGNQVCRGVACQMACQMAWPGAPEKAEASY